MDCCIVFTNVCNRTIFFILKGKKNVCDLWQETEWRAASRDAQPVPLREPAHGQGLPGRSGPQGQRRTVAWLAARDLQPAVGAAAVHQQLPAEAAEVGRDSLLLGWCQRDGCSLTS